MKTLTELVDDPVREPGTPHANAVDELRVPLTEWTDPAAVDNPTDPHIVRSID